MKRRGRRWVVGVALVVGAGVALIVALVGRSAPKPLDPALVVTAERTTLDIEILETGRIAPIESVKLKSKVAGQVTEVRVEEGQVVKRGQVLVLLDPTDYEREVARAGAEIAVARANIDYARLDVARKRQGVAAKVTSRAELDQAEYQLRSALANLRTSEVALRSAQDRVEYTTIVSPIDGTVIRKEIEVGEVVTPGVQATFEGRSLLTVADLTTLIVVVELNQIDVAKVRLGAKATVNVDALPKRPLEAVVTKIAPASVKPTSGQVEVFPIEATLQPFDVPVRPGMTADVRLLVDSKPNVLVLPIEAVDQSEEAPKVRRVLDEGAEGQRTEMREVALGASSDQQYEILSGLSPGDRVLISPPSVEGKDFAKR